MASIAERLDRLERENRRLKGIVALAAIVAFSLAATAQIAPQQKFTGQSFTLVDSTNHTRATLDMANFGGQPTLTMLNTDGRAVLRIGVTEKGGLVEAVDSTGKVARFPEPPGPRPLTTK